MARCIDGDLNLMNAVVFGTPDKNYLDIVRNQYDRLSNFSFNDVKNIAAPLVSWFNSAKETMFEFFDNGGMRAAEAAINNHAHLLDEDIIKDIWDISEFQNAKSRMQDVVMAVPEIYNLYRQNRIDGFSDTWFDNEPGAVGNDREIYRAIHNGVWMEQEIDGETSFKCEMWLEPVEDANAVWSFAEQLAALHAMENAKALAKTGNADLTSKYNAIIS